MSLLERHLEQITFCAESIATLPFPPPRIFTNALLSTHDITSLIRDTEPHERALFSVPPPPPPSTQQPLPSQKAEKESKSRRQTVFSITDNGEVHPSSNGGRAPRRNTAVAAVLGKELHEMVRRTEKLEKERGGNGKGEVDIEVLLRGAEKLNEVEGIEGVEERIRKARGRNKRLRGGLKIQEERVRRLGREVERLGRSQGEGDEEEEEEGGVGHKGNGEQEESEVEIITDEDLRREEEEIRELELRKKALEERVSGMERDLGGLLR